MSKLALFIYFLCFSLSSFAKLTVTNTDSLNIMDFSLTLSDITQYMENDIKIVGEPHKNYYNEAGGFTLDGLSHSLFVVFPSIKKLRHPFMIDMHIYQKFHTSSGLQFFLMCSSSYEYGLKCQFYLDGNSPEPKVYETAEDAKGAFIAAIKEILQNYNNDKIVAAVKGPKKEISGMIKDIQKELNK